MSPNGGAPDLAATVSAFTTLSPVGGSSLKGQCPFCDYRLPLFNVSPARGLWHCFGCQRGGDLGVFLHLIRNG
jgi:DNA primase